MLVRLAAIAATGFMLSGHLPRFATTGSHAWIVWLLAAVIVLGGGRLLRFGLGRVIGIALAARR